jgi:hypothetical protein
MPRASSSALIVLPDPVPPATPSSSGTFSRFAGRNVKLTRRSLQFLRTATNERASSHGGSSAYATSRRIRRPLAGRETARHTSIAYSTFLRPIVITSGPGAITDSANGGCVSTTTHRNSGVSPVSSCTPRT